MPKTQTYEHLDELEKNHEILYKTQRYTIIVDIGIRSYRFVKKLGFLFPSNGLIEWASIMIFSFISSSELELDIGLERIRPLGIMTPKDQCFTLAWIFVQDLTPTITILNLARMVVATCISR